MKLSGNYQISELARVFQGNFGCQSVNKNSKGRTLPSENQHIRLELFFIRFEIYKDKVIIYKIDDDTLTKICELPVANSD